jgi:hypothetical protein
LACWIFWFPRRCRHRPYAQIVGLLQGPLEPLPPVTHLLPEAKLGLPRPSFFERPGWARLQLGLHRTGTRSRWSLARWIF